MKYTFTLVATFCFVWTLSAQQLASWAQFRDMHYTINPAVKNTFDTYGGDNVIDADLAYRRQWTSFDDAPRTALAGLQYTNEYSNMSVGGFISNDQFGPTSYSQVQLSYAYHIQIDRSGEHHFSIGLSASAFQFRLDADKFRVENLNDNILSDAPQSKMAVNAGVGIYYQNPVGYSSRNPKYLLAGLSVEQAVPSDLPFDGRGAEANLKRELHYHFFGGYRSYFGDGYDFVEPVIWVRYVANAPVNTTFAVRSTFAEQRFWAGAGLSTAWEGTLMAGVGISEKLELGYATSFFLADTFGARAGMTHEFRLGYRVGL